MHHDGAAVTNSQFVMLKMYHFNAVNFRPGIDPWSVISHSYKIFQVL